MGEAETNGLAQLDVLVIDDDPHSLAIVKAILRGLGVGKVRPVADAGSAFRAMRDARPDIVFVDWLMNPLDGLDFVRLLRKGEDSPDPKVPVVMLTGHSQAHRVKEARDAGVTEFLVKPVSVRDIAAKLELVIRHPRSFIRTTKYVGPDRRRRLRPHDGADRRNAGAGEAGGDA